MKINQINQPNKGFFVILVTILMLASMVAVPSVAFADSPIVTTSYATSIRSTSAQLNGYVKPSASPVSAWFEWGTSSSVSNSVNKYSRNSKSKLEFFVKITDLQPATTYYFRAVSQDPNGISYGNIYSFTTASASRNNGNGSNGTSGTTPINTTTVIVPKYPMVSTTFATNVYENSASLSGFVDPQGTLDTVRWFEWGTSQLLGNNSGYSAAASVPHNFSFTISGLQKGVTYYYRAIARNQYGTVQGSVFSFTTGDVSSVPQSTIVAPLIIAEKPIILNSNSAQLKAMAIDGSAPVKEGYFEWGTSASALSLGTAIQPATGNPTPRFVQTITTLEPGKSYVYRAVVKDARGQIYRSQIVAFNATNFVAPTITTPSSAGNSSGTAFVKQNSQIAAKQNNQENDKISSGLASVLFTKTSFALIGWFLSIILLIVVIILVVMLKRKNENEKINNEINGGFKEFPEFANLPK